MCYFPMGIFSTVTVCNLHISQGERKTCGLGPKKYIKKFTSLLVAFGISQSCPLSFNHSLFQRKHINGMGFGLLPSTEEMKYIKRAVVSVEKQTMFRQFISVAESHAKKTL